MNVYRELSRLLRPATLLSDKDPCPSQCLNMHKCCFLGFVLLTVIFFGGLSSDVCGEESNLAENFRNPPMSARPSCYWWWFNNLMDQPAITRNLEEFKAKGMGGVMIVCTGSDGHAMPQGPVFLSPDWNDLFKFALQEAHRLDLEVGFNFCGGWCMGGPWIKPQEANRWFLQSSMHLQGPQQFSGTLPLPGSKDGYDTKPQGNVPKYINLPLEQVDYRDTSIIAFLAPNGKLAPEDSRKQSLPVKSNRVDANCINNLKELRSQTEKPWAAAHGDSPIDPRTIIDLTSQVTANGSLNWSVPPGDWIILRTGHRMTGAKISVPMAGNDGLSIDWLSKAGVDQQWAHLSPTVIDDAGPLLGSTLKYLGMDSVEDGYPNWTGNFLEEFKRYRCYDATPFLPVLAGQLVESAEISDRFLNDYRKTVADSIADNAYGHFADLSHAIGLAIACEAGGPNWSGTFCIDALKNLGRTDLPQGEFWQDGVFVENGQNRVGKQTATAAHIYGHAFASAEALTSFAPPWSDVPSTLKPTADRAFCEGINRFVFHTMTATRQQDGLPGYEYGAGTHFNLNVTWWQQTAKPWLDYISRCEYLLQSGLFVADVLYYNGDGAPNEVEPKHIDPSLGPGYDYDVCNSEVLLNLLSVKGGLLVLPNGQTYRMLVLPESKTMPKEVIQKLAELVKAGATVVGSPPESDPGLRDYPRSDEIVRQTARELWGDPEGSGQRKVGEGRIIENQPLKMILESDHIPPDFSYSNLETITSGRPFIDFIHRSTPGEEIYFLANRDSFPSTVNASFRVSKSSPELWDPVSGDERPLPEFTCEDSVTNLTLHFEAHGSLFIIFRKTRSFDPTSKVKTIHNFPEIHPIQSISGPWHVKFDPTWFYPTDGLTAEEVSGNLVFDQLDDWSQRPEPAIKYFSGTATYQKLFIWSGQLEQKNRVFVDLGSVKESAHVKLNGKDLGVVWCAPWRVEITGALKKGDNALSIEVVNTWPNRLIGDGKLPPNQRRTRTNIGSWNNGKQSISAGLLGPVQIVAADADQSP